MAKRSGEHESADVVTPGTPTGVPGRLVIPLLPNGRVDWARAGRKKDHIRKVVAELKRKTAPAPGEPIDRDDDAPAAAPAAGADVFTDTIAGVLFDVAGQLEVLAIVKIYKCTHDQAKIFLYSDGEKAALAGPLSRVLNKYSAAWLTAYADECALAALLLAVHAGKIQQLDTVLRKPTTPATVIAHSPRVASSPATADGIG
jgi:hypothetical protein